MDQTLYRQIPKMDRLLEEPAIREAAAGLPRTLVKEVLNQELQALRQRIQQGDALPPPGELTASMAEAVASGAQPHLRRVVNATGIILHTNLGRAPLGNAVAEQVAQVAAGYCNLEYTLESGTRGSRYDHIESLICRLTGTEAAMVVNNNAAAVFLMLNTLAEGQQVAVSRGELVEIGGAFRVPEIMKRSGAQLMEIGTTNKTHLYDYEEALEEGAGAILKVHSSNFKVLGFTEQVDIQALSVLAKDHGVPLLYDIGAGFLLQPGNAAMRQEGIFIPAAAKYADVVCFSGDKLLGGGQAGILAGKRDAIARMKKNQLTRMLRIDKLTLASLEAVLRLCLDPAEGIRQVPVLRMLETPAEQLRTEAEALQENLQTACPDGRFTVVRCTDEPGGGSLPALELPGYAVAAGLPGRSPNQLERVLRTGSTPIVCRIVQDQVLLSVRTLMPGDTETITAAFQALA